MQELPILPLLKYPWNYQFYSNCHSI